MAGQVYPRYLSGYQKIQASLDPLTLEKSRTASDKGFPDVLKNKLDTYEPGGSWISFAKW